MARIGFEDSKDYESQGSLDVFSLADDGDSDKVQLLMNSLADVIVYTCHHVPATSRNGRAYEKKVGCLRKSKDDPAGVCPLCDSGNKVKLAAYIPLYSHSHQQVQLWERGRQFTEKVVGTTLNRMISQGLDIKNTVVEIVRAGKKGDQQTTYQFYPMERETPADVSELEIPDPSGQLIAEWSESDMQNYIATGRMPETSNNNSNGVQRRRDAGNYNNYANTEPVRDNYSSSGYQSSPINSNNMVEVTDPADAF